MDARSAHAKAANQRLPLGWKEDGLQAYEYYRPSVTEFASDCVKAGCRAGKDVPFGHSVPLPSGMKLSNARNPLLLDVAEIHALRFGAYTATSGKSSTCRRLMTAVIFCPSRWKTPPWSRLSSSCGGAMARSGRKRMTADCAAA